MVEPFTMQKIIAKANTVLGVPNSKFYDFFKVYYIHDEEIEIGIVDDDDLQLAISNSLL